MTSSTVAVANSVEQKLEDPSPIATTSTATILMLGCGRVVPPLVLYLNLHGYRMVIATRTVSKADPIIKRVKYPQNITVHKFNIAKKSDFHILEKLTTEATLVISLLPWVYHMQAANVALKCKTHFFTTSYVKDAMMALNEEVLANNLLYMNECGVDPGLDHMSAAKIINEVHANNGLIRSFTSICGGLPAPEDNNNPYGYKFSWAPRGVLLASRSNASQLIDGKVMDVIDVDLFAPQNIFAENMPKIGDLEWYFNRDSIKYIEMYKIPEVQTMIRGTYRYPGWCETLKAMGDLQLTSLETVPTTNKTFGQYFRSFLKIADNETFASAVGRILNIADTENSVAIRNLEWLDLLRDEQIPENVENTPLDVLCYICLEKLKYEDNEKDMLLLKHTFEVEYPDDGWRETIEAIMLDFGLQPKGYSSMARTVSLPLAIAIKAFLEGRINTRGVVRPLMPEAYDIILNEIKELDITFEEKVLPPLIWMRDEVKPGERRCPITPMNCQRLIEAGIRVTVERSITRCIPDEEFARVGCKMVDSKSWMTKAPFSAVILGIKELAVDEPFILAHRHVYFAHCFKRQEAAIPLLKRFAAGNGELLDLEYLVDENGRRVAAFGRAAGMVGMAMAVITWCKQVLNETFESIQPFENEKAMVSYCQHLLQQCLPVCKRHELPAVVIMGALGRCGMGATYIAKCVGLKCITAWDRANTQSMGPGPYEAIVNDHELFVNCIRLQSKIEPFVTLELCQSKSRRLSVISDVSCDASSPNNPIPVYNEITSMVHPVRRIDLGMGNNNNNDDVLPLDVTAIDHLPSLIPLEASQQYSDDLVETLLELKNRGSGVWQRARETFFGNIKPYRQMK